MSEFVAEVIPEWKDLFDNLPIPILKADFFRYLVVLALGGTYADIDTRCLRDIASWTNSQTDIGAVIGVEFDASDVSIDLLSVKLQFVQWTFAARPNHPLLQRVVGRVLHQLSHSNISESTVHQLTGPTIWSDAIIEYFSTLGYHWRDFRSLKEPKLVQVPTGEGNVLVLPITGFNPDLVEMGGKGSNHPDSLVQHLFYGSWKRPSA
ncbi:membrane-bound alpha-1,6- mannosyltransferase Initiation-specific [Gaertneriomyces sp. JEL0708]|nr:membrane-bound alpha-1,6- mannosyltransferase Initiation-specific [Gaertneriomyces sp. JEL0708]